MDRKSLWGAHLFLPANNAGFIEALPLINVQNVILDLEYATDLSKKTEARHLAKYAIKYLRSMRSDMNIAVRVNIPYFKELCKLDVETVIDAKPDSIRIPSVTNGKEIEFIDDIITKSEAVNNNSQQKTKLHVMIENPTGLKNIKEIASSSDRISALCLGGEDWVSNLGLERTKESRELEYIRNIIVAISIDNNLIPIDSVYPWLEDKKGLEVDSKYSRNIGFCARAIQNPKQIDIVNKIYAPSKEKLDWAAKIILSLNVNNIYGCKGYVSNGKILDSYAVNQAKMVHSFMS